MRRMKSRIALLVSLLVISGLLASIQPASAGPWTAQIQFVCEMKRVAGLPFVYPSLGPSSDGTDFSISCGKGKPAKHVQPGVPSTPEYCQITQLAPNGKKPTKTKPVGTTSNCNIKGPAPGKGPIRAFGGCGSSLGVFSLVVTSKPAKTIGLTGSWFSELGDTLRIFGNSQAPKPGTFLGLAEKSPNHNKGQSCIPSRDKEGNGADSFKITGELSIVGTKTK